MESSGKRALRLLLFTQCVLQLLLTCRQAYGAAEGRVQLEEGGQINGEPTVETCAASSHDSESRECRGYPTSTASWTDEAPAVSNQARGDIPHSAGVGERQKEALALFESAMALLNDSNPDQDRVRAYALLSQSATIGHQPAQRMMGIAHLFGDMEAAVEFDPIRARRLLEPLAMGGDPEAQLYFGFMHSFGLAALEPSQAKAIILYTFASIGGNQLAHLALGYRHYAGLGLAQSCEKSLDHYRRVAASVEKAFTVPGGYQYTAATSTISSKLRLYDEYENPSRMLTGQLSEDLIQYYRFLADKGDVHAQVGLGHLHYQGGRGVQQNHTRALTYFLQAANTGNANAMAYLGKMFLEGGKAVQQNNEAAFKYFSMAAEKGNPVGQAGLGTMFLYGQGIPKDHDRALRYLMMAANQGLVHGQFELGNMFYHGFGVERNYKIALKYYQQASSGGHVLALYNLGMMNAQGIGVDQRSCQNAVILFKAVSEQGRSTLLELSRAYDIYKVGGKRVDEALVRYGFLAELGYEPAQSNAAFILDRAEARLFSDQNASYTKAFTYWARAASQGYVTARLKLGDYHYYGYGTPVDFTQSAFHYRVAAESESNPQAMFNLAYMHEQGYGLPKDIYLAKRYYDLAATTSYEAKIPVMLAQLKLAIVYGKEYLDLLGYWSTDTQTSDDAFSSTAFLSLQKSFALELNLYIIGLLFIFTAVMAYLQRIL
ncbi:protein sel-11-like [Tropilaelaps mercedesae]|uniref:Protein sel-11-like n=1 Tax=Tropilaelaps mercedesae TaxID=418985 RepID=A0A1V9XY43_9ACAR|nr:protein sel-11-like [Tropilaelaps mercedesae]